MTLRAGTSREAREERTDFRTLEHEEGFEGLGGDDQDAGRALQELPLARRGDVAVPAVDEDVQVGAQAHKAFEFVNVGAHRHEHQLNMRILAPAALRGLTARPRCR